MTERPKMLLAVGDAGAWAYFSPIFPQLQKLYNVRLLADPKGAARNDLDKADIPYTLSDGSELFASNALDGVAAVICGTAGKAPDLWENATSAALEAEVPVAWCGDFYRSGCEIRMHDYMPDYFASFDDTTMAAFQKVHPHMLKNCIRIVGNPSFDAIASLNISEARQRVRADLHLKESETFVLYSASSISQFALEKESLDNLIKWVNGRTRFAVRFHPADEKNNKEEIARLRNRLANEVGPGMVEVGDCKGLELAAASDAFITDYSTEGVQACLAGIPTAFLMLESSQKYLSEKKFGEKPFFSVLDEGSDIAPALGIYEPCKTKDLYLLLTPLWHERQKRALKLSRFQVLCDGHAGGRVLEFIQKIVGKTP